MKTPICDICLKSDILCLSCRDKVERGIVQSDDIQHLRKMKEVSKKIKPLEGIRIKRLINMDDLMLVICRRGDANRLIGRGGTIVNNLSRAMDKKVRVVEETSDIKTFLEMLVFPVPVLSIGKVFRESGESFRMRVPSEKDLPVSKVNINQAAMEMFGQGVEVVTE